MYIFRVQTVTHATLSVKQNLWRGWTLTGTSLTQLTLRPRYTSIQLSIYSPIYLYITSIESLLWLGTYWHSWHWDPVIHLSSYLSIHLSTYLSIYQKYRKSTLTGTSLTQLTFRPWYTSIYLSIHLST